MPTKLVLASTSAYRRALLRQLGLEFQPVYPDFEEPLPPDESAANRATRLARLKASCGMIEYLENVLDINDIGEINNGITSSMKVIGSD